MVRHGMAVGAAILFGMAASPAQAQYSIVNSVIANTISRMSSADPCLLAMPEDELVEARDPSMATMQQYFAAASAGQAISPMFKAGKKSKSLDSQTDPLAKAGNSLDTQPLRFFRASTYSTALGQWAVRDSTGGVIGVYTAHFQRERGAWLIRDLFMSKADDIIEPIASYCSTPGDMTQRRIANSEDGIKWAEEQLAKRKQKLDEANAKAIAAETKGGSDAKKLRAKADREAKRLTDAETSLANARETNAKAVAAAEELKRLTGPAKDAERFRLD